MKTITLIRHGKSSRKNPEIQDFDRPLNKRGKTDALLMGSLLAKKSLKADLFLSSPAERTLKTAKLIAGRIEYTRQKIHKDIAFYLATEAVIISLLAKLDDEYDHVMLCGHNPGISGAVNFLAGRGYDEMPTCGVAHFELNVSSWKDLVPGCGSMMYYDFPKNHY